MKISIPEGKYVLAVSGGVDSMVLLDLLAKQVTGYRLQVTDKKMNNSNLQPLTSNLSIVVAHFNHGIRPDAAKDEELVRQAAKHYKLTFEAGRGKLGAATSEADARQARYKFLRQVKAKHQAGKIITAHHQDDLLETVVINLLRGSGRRGLTAIADNPDVVRPLLKYPKSNIYKYAKRRRLVWREDTTNSDEDYLRNYIRLQIIPRLSERQRQQLLQNVDNLIALNKILNLEIAKTSQEIIKDKTLDRNSFIGLPAEVNREVLIYFLRSNGIYQYDKPMIERLLVAIKTAKAGSTQNVTKGVNLDISEKSVLLN